MQKSGINRLRTVLSVLLLLLIIFSFSFTVAEIGHEACCTEDNCQICFVIQVVKANLEVLVLSLAAFSVFRHFEKSEKFRFVFIKNPFKLYTLFSLKTRLND